MDDPEKPQGMSKSGSFKPYTLPSQQRVSYLSL
jgi:hypothetical protein